MGIQSLGVLQLLATQTVSADDRHYHHYHQVEACEECRSSGFCGTRMCICTIFPGDSYLCQGLRSTEVA